MRSINFPVRGNLLRITMTAVILVCLSLTIQAQQDEFPNQPGLHAQRGIDLIPEPQIASFAGGGFNINSGTVICSDPKLQDSLPLLNLREGMQEILNLTLKESGSKTAGNAIHLILVQENDLQEIPSGNPRKEGYRLEVSPTGISVKAAHPAGIFYGIQTLLQLAGQKQGNIPGLKISDWPDMEFRGIHVDLWYHLDRPWYYEYLFKQLSRYKINAAVFEFEDKFPFSKHPVLSAPGAMTREQVKELVNTAKKYYIEIIPLAQTLGHAAFIAKHPEFTGLRELPISNWELCPLKEGTLSLAKDIIEEQLELIQPSKYFHIGGDEAYEMGKGAECKAKWGDKALVESYKVWLKYVCDYLKKQGKTAIVWDDMFLKYFSREDMANMPDNLIYMRWEYGTGSISEKDRKIVELGYPVWIATAAQTMTPVFPDQKLRVFNNANLVPAAASLGMKGVLNTAWEDAGVHPETYWIGFVCSAEYSWTAKKPASDEFTSKFYNLFYGDEQKDMDKAYSILSERGFTRAESSWTRDFGALELPSLPDNDFKADSSWIRKNRNLVNQARVMRPRYAEAVSIIERNMAANTKNKYNQEVLLLCAKTILHFTDLILDVNEINDNLLKAYAEHQKGDDPSAFNRYQQIGRIIDDLRFEKSNLFDETERVWETSMYPKDFSDIPGGREKFIHQIDLANYYGNKTMDLSYIFEVEEGMNLFGWQQKLYRTMSTILRNNRQ